MMKAGNNSLFRPARFRAFEQALREEYNSRMVCVRAVEIAENRLRQEIDNSSFKAIVYREESESEEVDTVDKLLPIPSSSPAKKDLQLVQSSLENPLSSYMSSRRSFTTESPHFGQIREPSTPQSLSKHPLHQQLAESNARMSQHLMNIAADGLIVAEDSNFTFQGALNDSNMRYDLKFDSFQQKPQAKKHNNIQIMNNYCRQVKEQSQEEDLKNEELNHQQSTSEPKSTDFYISRDEEEDLEQLIASVSKRASKVPGAPPSNIFSSESTSHQESINSNAHFSERPELSDFIPDTTSNATATHNPVMMRSMPFSKSAKDNINIFKESLLEANEMSADFGLLTPRNNESNFDKENLNLNFRTCGNKEISQAASYYAKLMDRNLKQLDYAEDLVRGFKRKRLNGQPFCELQTTNLKAKKDTSFRPTTAKEKGLSTNKKKSQSGLSLKIKSKINVDMTALNNKFKSNMANAGSTTPRMTSARKLKTTGPPLLRLDFSQTARSPRQTIQSISQVVNSTGSARISRKIGFFKDRLMSKIAQAKSPGADKSFNASTLMKSVYQQPKRIGNKSQTPLSKKELKKFMDKRKFTSTMAMDFSGTANTRSAVRLKSKRKSNSDIAEKSDIVRSKTLVSSSIFKREDRMVEAFERNSARQGVRESKESASSYLGELLHERGFARETLRASRESKMGEADRAKLRQMGDNHLELSKCLTSRAKKNLEIPLENTFVKNKVKHLRKYDKTTDKCQSSRATKLTELEIGQPASPDFTKFSKPQTENNLHRSREWSGKVGYPKVDISNLSSRVLSTLNFES